jgi:hypothetical protein
MMGAPNFRWREFIEDADGRGSASRLNMVIGVLIGSVVILFLTFYCMLKSEIFATYMLATGGVYCFGKNRESAVQMQQIKSDSPSNSNSSLPSPAPSSPPETPITGGGDRDVQKTRKK